MADLHQEYSVNRAVNSVKNDTEECIETGDVMGKADMTRTLRDVCS